jgi:hypothetical protein
MPLLQAGNRPHNDGVPERTPRRSCCATADQYGRYRSGNRLPRWLRQLFEFQSSVQTDKGLLSSDTPTPIFTRTIPDACTSSINEHPGAYMSRCVTLRRASSLAAEFGRGFDTSNLLYLRLFYQAFPIRDVLRHELSWTPEEPS